MKMFLTVTEARQEARCGLRMLLEHIRAGKLRALRFPHNKIRIYRRDLDTWIATRVIPVTQRRGAYSRRERP